MLMNNHTTCGHDLDRFLVLSPEKVDVNMDVLWGRGKIMSGTEGHKHNFFLTPLLFVLCVCVAACLQWGSRVNI